MSASTNPPPIARWHLERALPADVREDVSGDLIEVFNRECQTRGTRRARQRYWHTSMSVAARFAIERCRDLLSGSEMRTGISWLEVRLALRMLVRYPGLSLAGGIGMAVVIACGIGAAVFDAVVHGTLPFEDGHRIVALENRDVGPNRAHTRALHDFAMWRETLKSVEQVGAYRLTQKNLTIPGHVAEPVRVAEISASAFQVARVPPLMGRYLVADDERAAAAPVVVIGEEAWQQRFAADSQIIGRTVQLGATSATVVGVMPREFGFPVNERFWVPLRLNPVEYPRGQGPELSVFGRLADGVDLQTAQAELSTIGQRSAADFPDTHAQLRPQVVPYTEWFFVEMQNGETMLFGGAVLMLLGIVCANVAVLVYARTALRRHEIAVRTALGASRWRLVWQMFLEGLALAAVAAAIGVGIAAVARAQLDVAIAQAPFWVNANLTSGTVVMYVLALTVLGGGIVGVVPALQATRGRAQAGLHHAASLSTWRVGRTYSVLTIVQVALAVAMLPAAVSTSWTAIQLAGADPGFPADEFLMARLSMDQDSGRQFDATLERFEQRLEAEPNVAAMTFMTSPPGSESRTAIEVEDGALHAVGGTQVSVDYFSTFGIPLLAGRGFVPQDATSATRPIVVNHTFAQKILGGNALGRRVRTVRGDQREPWLEVVGVIPDFPMLPVESTVADATLYEPIGRSSVDTLLVGVHVRGETPTALVSRLRDVTTRVDRSLQLRDTMAIDAYLDQEQNEYRLAAWSTGMISLSVLLLSATGLYALMAFAVTQRRREIGIRIAVGANQSRILRSIVSRAMLQLAAGILIGVALAAFFDSMSDGELTGGAAKTMLPAVGVFVLLVGFAAAAVPARRALRIQPIEALREE